MPKPPIRPDQFLIEKAGQLSISADASAACISGSPHPGSLSPRTAANRSENPRYSGISEAGPSKNETDA